MVDIVTRLGKGSPLTNAEVDANFTNLAEVSGVTGEPMGHEDRTTSTISFNASTRTFTIAPVASSFTVWCKGKKVVVSTAQTVTIPNTTGMYSIYYDANGVLSAKSGYFTFSLEAPTAYVYWNATTGTCPYFGDERHGVVLDWQTHEYLHRTRGAALASGFSASGYVLGGNGSSNSHAQITLEGGTFFDEDMKIIVTATNTPTAGTWEQDLLSPARIPVLYLSGTGWVIDAPTDYPLKQGTARPQYNAYSGGVWSTADVTNNKYATSWILATNNLTYPVIAIIGQAENDLQSAAEAVDFTALQLPGFPSVEFRPLYKLIFQCADSCSNAVHASLMSITDIRSIAAAGTAASIVTDHGNLSGLSDDDHPQYIHVDTLRTVSAAVKASFLPSQTSNAGKFLQTDGTATSWQALTSSNVTTALGFTPYNATNPSGYISGITSGMVTTALGFTPYNATNPSGYVTAAGARGAISVTGAGSYDSATGVINIVGGVTSFNTRTGAITLSSADVTTALGFTPYNNTNPSGYITGITSTMVTTALGFTPYNSSNPNGYISSITSANVTTALGFTPYNATNPSGYITSSALSGYLTSASAASTYLTDAMRSRGSVAVANIDTATLDGFYTQNNAGDSDGLLVFNSGGSLGPFQLHAKYTGLLRFRNKTDSTTWTGWKTVIHDGNYSSYAPTLTGGGASGTWGINVTGTAGSISGYNNPTTGATANTIAYRDSGGDIYQRYSFAVHFNQSGGNSENPTIGQIWTNSTSDNYVRKSTPAHFISQLSLLTTTNYSSYALPLSGGTVTGQVISSANGNQLRFVRADGTTPNWTFHGWGGGLNIYSSAASTLYIGRDGPGTNLDVYNGSLTQAGNQVLHAGNYSSYALPLSGGTMTGTISYSNVTGTKLSFYQVPADKYGIDVQSSELRIYSGASGDAVGGITFGKHDGTTFTEWMRVRNNGAVVISGNQVLHASNFSSYAHSISTDPSTPGPGALAMGSNGSYSYVQSHAGQTLRLNPVGNLVQVGTSTVLHASNYTSYSPSLGGSGASGTWGISISGNASSATRLINLRTINGIGFDGTANIDTTEWFHSDRDFPSGTLITTNINYAVTYGDPFVLEIRGNSYGNIVPLDLQYQGYIYADTIINHGGLSNGLMIQGLVAINNGGNLCFWFPSQGYWNGYNVKVYAAYATRAVNRVTSITGGGKPTTAKEVALTANIRQSLNSGNYTSYSPSLTGSGASGTWSINVTGSANTANTASNSNTVGGLAPAQFFNNMGNGHTSYTDFNSVPGFGNYYVQGSTNSPTGISGNQFYGFTLGLGNDYPLSLYATQIYWPRRAQNGETYIYIRDREGGSWNGWTKARAGVADSIAGFNNPSASATANTIAYRDGAGDIEVRELRMTVGVQSFTPSSLVAIYPTTNQAVKVSAGGARDFLDVPTRGGSGASGTWGINISGASDRTYRGIIEDTRAGQRSPNAYDDYRAHFEFTDQIVGDWHTAFTMQGWHDGYSAWQIIGPASTSAHENWYLRSGVNTSWNSVRTILHSGNYSSYSPPYSGGTLSGNWYFNTSAGSTSGALASPALQAYSTGNNAAWFSWHKAGHYAVNMGLDSDNVLRIGGWSASANRWQLDMSGNMTVAGNVTAYSDERLKKDWAPVRSGFVEALASIKSGTYTRIDSEERQAGVSAQDWQKLLPETVSTDNEGKLSLAYGNAALVSAVELAKKIVEQEKRIAQLESLINKLIGD